MRYPRSSKLLLPRVVIWIRHLRSSSRNASTSYFPPQTTMPRLNPKWLSSLIPEDCHGYATPQEIWAGSGRNKKNYRPISNLPFMSKVIEKLVLSQLICYLTANGLFTKFQSGFRIYHSLETAVLRVLYDIYSAIDQDQVSLFALLDVSAAFVTVDHGILLERLSTSYGLSGMAYTLLESYISLAENISFTLATATHLHPNISLVTFKSLLKTELF